MYINVNLWKELDKVIFLVWFCIFRAKICEDILLKKFVCKKLHKLNVFFNIQKLFRLPRNITQIIYN